MRRSVFVSFTATHNLDLKELDVQPEYMATKEFGTLEMCEPKLHTNNKLKATCPIKVFLGQVLWRDLGSDKEASYVSHLRSPNPQAISSA